MSLFFFCCRIGSLTFDEFQTLMEQVELGISPQELRFVISEADENENGVVDYEEFVPLAVDLIQSFRARNRAKTIYSQRDVEVDELIMQAISTKDLERISDVCLEKIYEIDTKKYGLIRVPELKRCLNTIAHQVGLKENEISMICQMLPKDQFERCKYNTAPNNFLEVLSKVRFMTMKNAMIEQQGSGLQKYLLDLCREEEARIASDGHAKAHKDSHAVTGKIPFRALINILTNSSRLSLTRLQVLVIMSEAHVQEGMINYFQFVPVVAKAIEIMFEPKALRQRAELIEKTDLSPEALLQGMQSDMFEQRLMTLFKSYDIDKSGSLDQNEFIACLESLDLQLSYAEMVALMASADVNHTGALSFQDFMGFFTHNLLNLERERHVRLMQNSMNSQTHVVPLDPLAEILSPEQDLDNAEVSNAEQNEFIDHLTNIFKLSDTDASGRIPFEEFENVLRTFNVTASKYLMDVMLGELHVDEQGMVEYSEAVVSCGELLKVRTQSNWTIRCAL
jgi:Ca2+-binding EF-hand superfamily protein